MVRSADRRLGLLGIAALLAAHPTGAQDTARDAVERSDVEALRLAHDLLRSADTSRFAPASFRAHLRITPPDHKNEAEIEVWRRGGETLVRFLEPKERGKFLLYLDPDVYFLAPGSKKPVKLPKTFRLRGSATLDDLLGAHYSEDYRIAAVRRDAGSGVERVVLTLEADRAGIVYPKVLYTVNPANGLPVRAESFVASGRLASVVDFVEWHDPSRRLFRRLLLRDMLRDGAVTEVELIELEARDVPALLFDLTDRSLRAGLGASGSLTK